MAKKNYEELSNRILELVGGSENVSYLTHCVTRLRFNVKDRSKVKLRDIEELNGVIGGQWSGEQLQVIIGPEVSDVYKVLVELVGDDVIDTTTVNKDKKKFGVSLVIDAIAGCMTPIIPILIASGLIKVILLISMQLGLMNETNSTYLVLNFVSDSGFYFLPVFVGASAAKRFNVSMGFGMLIGAMLIHPDFIRLVAEGEALSVFGIPVHATSYATTIFPVIMSVWIMSYVDKFFIKISPESLRSIIEPLGTILVMIPITLCLVGPLGGFLGNYLTAGIMWIYDMLGFLGVAILSALFPLMVLTGMQVAVFPYMLQSFATLGFEPFCYTAAFISNFNQGVACIAVAIRTKDKEMKTTAISSAITALVGGVTEPATLGVNVKLKTPLVGSMIGSFIGAAYAGIMAVHCYSFPGSAGVFGLPAFIGGNEMNLIHMIIGIVIGMIATFIATLILYKGNTTKEKNYGI